MDLYMPVVDGFEASMKIRKLLAEHGMNPYICLLTQNTSEEIKQEAKRKDYGINQVFTKPIFKNGV